MRKRTAAAPMRAFRGTGSEGVGSAAVPRWIVLVGLAFAVAIVADLVLMFTAGSSAGY
jgi:hypothetical protein